MPIRFSTIWPRMDRLDRLFENGIFILVGFVLLFGPLATGAVRAVDFLVIQWATVASVFLWLVRLWLGANNRLLWAPVCWVVILFVGYAIIRYQLSDVEYAARQELIRVLVYAAIFFVVLNNLNRPEYPRWLACALVFLGMAISMYAVYQFATKSTRVWNFSNPIYQGRGTGTYINPNHLAGFLEMVLPLGAALLMIGRLGHVLRIVLGYASLVILAGIGITFSRGGWIAAILALSLFFAGLALRKSLRLPALLGLIILLAGITAFVVNNRFVQERFQHILKLGGQSPISRKILWRAAYEIWQDHFWWGAGPAHFDYRFGARRPPIPEIQMRADRVHNDYLNTLADWGLAGALIVASAWAVTLVGFLKSLRHVRHNDGGLGMRTSNRAALLLGTSTGLCAILIHSFTDFNMHIPANAILAVTLMALVSGHLRFVSERYWVAAAAPTRAAFSMLLAVTSIYLAAEAVKRGRQEFWLGRADKAEKYSAQQIEQLKKAHAVEPMNFETAYRIGEAYRIQAWPGNAGYEALTGEARRWFARAMRLNPYDALGSFSHLHYGMCLHHLGRHSEADPYFQRAVQNEPNYYYVAARMGWHYLQLGDFPAAKTWLEHSVRLGYFHPNQAGKSYLQIVNRKLTETPSR